jgi:hypothetical protein
METMTQLVALSLAIAVLGGIATWICLTIGLLIWAAFIAWACFFASGGDTNALKKTIVDSIWGAICGWVAAMVILSVAAPLPLPVWAGIVVAVTVFILCAAAHVELLNNIPASVLGYAAVFAYLLQTPDALTTVKLTSPTMGNAFIVVVISLVLGAVFGFLSGKLGAALKSKETRLA